MEKYTCPICNKTTYTAYRDAAQTCPYCTTEKLLILNPAIFNSAYDVTEAKILFDRRSCLTDIEHDRRGTENIHMIPIAWLIVKPKSESSKNI